MTVKPGPGNSVSIHFKFDEPVKRFRTRTVALNAHLNGETGFDTPSYEPILSSDSSYEAQSLFSRLDFKISWDGSLEPNWNRISWKEYRGNYDYQRGHSALRGDKGERVRLSKHQNAIGASVKPNTFNTFLRLESGFTRPR